jgi:hypothetical protein
MTKITQTQTIYTKKPGTKTVWLSESSTTAEVTEERYNHFVSAAPFFRRLGGYVAQKKGYTTAGYRVTEDVTTDPSKSLKKVTRWDFEHIGGERA